MCGTASLSASIVSTGLLTAKCKAERLAHLLFKSTCLLAQLRPSAAGGRHDAKREMRRRASSGQQASVAGSRAGCRLMGCTDRRMLRECPDVYAEV